MMGYKVGN